MRALGLAALLLSTTALAEPATERVVFHTVAGDLVFALDVQAAPKTVEQIVRLVRAGVYDGTAVARIAPGFIAQVSTAQDRLTPLTPEQKALLQHLPLEASALKHVRGALSLAHPDGDVNSGESSFCVMLGNAPHLDGQYTIFGKLEAGQDVLEQMLAVPRHDRTPTTRLTITRAEVLDPAVQSGPIYLAAAHPVGTTFGGAAAEGGPLSREGLLTAGLALMVLLSLIGAWFRARISSQLLNSLLLVVVLVGSFLLLALLMPDGQHRPWLGALLFFGMVGVFKALGRFETAVDRSPPATR